MECTCLLITASPVASSTNTLSFPLISPAAAIGSEEVTSVALMDGYTRLFLHLAEEEVVKEVWLGDWEADVPLPVTQKSEKSNNFT